MRPRLYQAMSVRLPILHLLLRGGPLNKAKGGSQVFPQGPHKEFPIITKDQQVPPLFAKDSNGSAER